MTPPEAGCSYALLADGTTIQIRPASEADTEAVLRFHQAMSPENLYLRFFGLGAVADREARRVCRPPGPGHAALLAVLQGRVVGLASYETGTVPGVAEVAFAVADDMHGRGIATLLLEHLVSIGRARQVETFRAETLPENTAMLRVFAAAGLAVRRKLVDNVVELTMPLPRAVALGEPSAYLDAVAHRESLADVASLRPLLSPESVVVVGAGRRPGTVGRSILENIVGGGYAGRVYAVNPNACQIGPVPCLPSVADLPEAPDLAVIAVPAAAVAGAAEECGQHGVRGIVVITSALERTHAMLLLAACRRHSMRLVGPNCFGIAVPGIGLDATFAAAHPAPGAAGLVMQSGGLGFAMLQHLSRIGVGISSFVSVGNKYDVSGNDLLTWWEQDGLTRLAVLYLESFGNPRKFARTARRVGRSMPLLTVYAGRTQAGQRAATLHTAAARVPLISGEALFQQAGIIATATFGELVDAATLLATQPVPTGPRVAVISNVGGGGVLAADACVEAGLTIRQPSDGVRQQLARIVPSGGALTGPVDTTAAISPAGFQHCLELVAADEGVDAVLALILPTALSNLLPAVQGADVRVPLAVVVMHQPEGVRVISRTGQPAAPRVQPAPQTQPASQTQPAPEVRLAPRAQPAPGSAAGRPPVQGMIPAYAYPEGAARALGHAARYGAWRSRPPSTAAVLPGLRPASARRLVTEFLTRLPGGGWLPPAEVRELLACYGVPLPPAAATQGVGRPPVRDVGRETDSGTGRETVEAELSIGVRQDPVFGPVVVFCLAGLAAEVPGDHAARLAPLTPADADDMIRSVRAAPLLGQQGTPAVGVAALRDVLLRVGQLADDLPQVAGLDLDPVIAGPDGISAVAARVRVTSRESADPFLRRLLPLTGP